MSLKTFFSAPFFFIGDVFFRIGAAIADYDIRVSLQPKDRK